MYYPRRKLTCMLTTRTQFSCSHLQKTHQTTEHKQRAMEQGQKGGN